MPVDAIFLLPWGSQIDELVLALREAGGRFVVVYDEFCDITSYRDHPNIDWLWHKDFLADPGRYSGVRCLPVTEAGIYLLNASGALAHACLSMSKAALFCITKLEQSAFLSAAGVLQIDKSIVASPDGVCLPTIGYPLIVKPNFGFASMFTKSVRTSEELIEHLEFYQAEVKNTQLHHFSSLYFESLRRSRQLDVMIAEKAYVDWDFYSVVYVVRDGSVYSVFPCRGMLKAMGKYSSFAWRAFASIVEQTPKPAMILAEVGRKLVPALGVLGGVFSIEILISPEADDYRVLEFECRPMGSWMNRLIDYSFGVNLDRVFIDFFLGLRPTIDTNRRQAGLITRNSDTSPVFERLTNFTPVAIDRRESGGAMLTDCLYDHEALAALQIEEPVSGT